MLRKDCHRHVIEKRHIGRRQAERNGLVVRHRNLLDVFKVRRVLRAVVGIHDGFDRELYVRCGEGLPIVPRDAGFQVEGVGVRLFVKIPALSKTRYDVILSVVGGQTVEEQEVDLAVLVHRGVDARVVAGAVDQRGGLRRSFRGSFLRIGGSCFAGGLCGACGAGAKRKQHCREQKQGKKLFHWLSPNRFKNPAGRLCLLLSYQTARRILSSPGG